MLPIKDENPTYRRGWVTLALIVVNVAVFVFVQQRTGTEVLDLPDGGQARIDTSVRFVWEYAAIPCELVEQRPLDQAEFERQGEPCADTPGGALFPHKQVWLAGLTSMFLHADWFHLGFNMLFLWIFGNNIEDHTGKVRYLAFYTLAGVAALVAHVALQPDSAIPVVGASGAIAGVMGAYAVWFPRAPVRTVVLFLLLLVVRVPAVALLGVWFVTQFFIGDDSGVAWAAHVGGFVFGAAFGLLVRTVPGMTTVWWIPPYRHSQRPGHWDSTGGVGSIYRTDAPRFGGRNWR